MTLSFSCQKCLPDPPRPISPAADPKDGQASPLYAVPEVLPPLLIQVGGDEVVLDDARHYAQKAAATGGEVQLDIFEGLRHVLSKHRAFDAVAVFLTRHWA